MAFVLLVKSKGSGIYVWDKVKKLRFYVVIVKETRDAAQSQKKKTKKRRKRERRCASSMKLQLHSCSGHYYEFLLPSLGKTFKNLHSSFCLVVASHSQLDKTSSDIKGEMVFLRKDHLSNFLFIFLLRSYTYKI